MQEIERYKAFISRATDRFRASFGRHVAEYPRQAVMWGTTNQDMYLKDETGGRRFWPVRCGSRVDVEAIERDRDQIWAEAFHRYNQGTSWWLNDANVAAMAEEVQNNRREGDPWEPLIADYLAGCRPLQGSDNKPATTVSEVLAHLEVEPKSRTSKDEKRMVACLRKLGWRRGPKPRVGSSRVQLYVPQQ